jgi:hypothetical protein
LNFGLAERGVKADGTHLFLARIRICSSDGN